MTRVVKVSQASLPRLHKTKGELGVRTDQAAEAILRFPDRVNAEQAVYPRIGTITEPLAEECLETYRGLGILAPKPQILPATPESVAARMAGDPALLTSRESEVLLFRFGLKKGDFKSLPIQREVAKAMGLSVFGILKIERRALGKLGLERPGKGWHAIRQESRSVPKDLVVMPATSEAVLERMADYPHALTPREKKVLSFRFCLKNGQCQTLNLVAKSLKLSPSAICIIQDRALKKLALEPPQSRSQWHKIRHLNRKPEQVLPRVEATRELVIERMAHFRGKLTLHQEEVISLRFGLDEKPPMTLQQVLNVLGLKDERSVSRTQRRGLDRLGLAAPESRGAWHRIRETGKVKKRWRIEAASPESVDMRLNGSVRITPYEKQVLVLRFGLEGEQPTTLEGIANRLQKNFRLIWKAQSRALKKLSLLPPTCDQWKRIVYVIAAVPEDEEIRRATPGLVAKRLKERSNQLDFMEREVLLQSFSTGNRPKQTLPQIALAQGCGSGEIMLIQSRALKKLDLLPTLEE